MPGSVVGQLWFLGEFFCGTKILGTGRYALLSNLSLGEGLIRMLPFPCFGGCMGLCFSKFSSGMRE